MEEAEGLAWVTGSSGVQPGTWAAQCSSSHSGLSLRVSHLITCPLQSAPGDAGPNHRQIKALAANSDFSSPQGAMVPHGLWPVPVERSLSYIPVTHT